MILETKRLRLEPFATEHADSLYVMNSNPDVMRYIGPVQTLDDVKASITRMTERWARLGYG